MPQRLTRKHMFIKIEIHVYSIHIDFIKLAPVGGSQLFYHPLGDKAV
jgi:hypothetical protein